MVALFDRVRATPNRGATLISVWASAFGIEPPSSGPTLAGTGHSLRLFARLGEEYERAVATFQLTPLEEDDYLGAIEKPRTLFRADLMYTGFGQVADSALSSEVMGILRIGSRLVPKTEHLLSADELKEIDDALEALRLATQELPDGDALKSVLLEQLADIQESRLAYDISGASVLRDAMFGLEGAIINVVPDEHQSNKTTADVVVASLRLSRALRTALATAGLAAALGSAVDGAAKIGEGLARAQLFLTGTGGAVESPPVP